MSFPTLGRRNKASNHIKQSSFDVSELAAAGRLKASSSLTSHSTEKLSPLTPFKRLSQFFRRQSSEPVSFTHSNQSIDKNHTFGRSLPDICTPELPKAIVDLLTFLQEVGPFTREIFRKPPNAKRCRLLVDKLNTNADSFHWEVDESCNGLLLAAVLKTFLREIPHKVCDDRLYNQWSAMLQDTRKDSVEEKVTRIKQLITQLPESNQLLLKCIISILHRVQQRCLDNLMNSYNLSVCLGPCLLWTQSTNCREIENASKTVPCLIEFLITNCVEIFGTSVLSVLRVGDNSLTRNTSMSLDSIFTDKPKHYIDSHSMDTLTDQLGRQQMSPSRLSFDSGMVLDDVSHDGEAINDSKSSEPIHKRFNVSYDSLDCDAYASDDEVHVSEHVLKHENNNSLYVNLPCHHTKITITEGKKMISSDSTATICSDGYQTKTTSPDIRESCSGLLRSKTLRPVSTPGNTVVRNPSVSYDKIVYRYIEEPQNISTTDGKYYSLPRHVTKVRQPQRATHMSTACRLPASTKPTELTSVTCGHSAWQPADVPIIVVDKCQQDGDKSKKHVTRLQILPNYPKQVDCIDGSQKQVTATSNTEPIYENSELYGPSTLNRQRLRTVTQSVPLYENLPFHRQQPTIRSRSRNTTNSYTTYRQQTYHSRPSLFPVFEHRGNNFKPSQTVHRRTQSHLPTMLETCYFV